MIILETKVISKLSKILKPVTNLEFVLILEIHHLKKHRAGHQTASCTPATFHNHSRRKTNPAPKIRHYHQTASCTPATFHKHSRRKTNPAPKIRHYQQTCCS